MDELIWAETRWREVERAIQSGWSLRGFYPTPPTPMLQGQGWRWEWVLVGKLVVALLSPDGLMLLSGNASRMVPLNVIYDAVSKRFWREFYGQVPG